MKLRAAVSFKRRAERRLQFVQPDTIVLELDRSASLMLRDHGTFANVSAPLKVFDLDLDYVTTAQLAVDREVERCTDADPILVLPIQL